MRCLTLCKRYLNGWKITDNKKVRFATISRKLEITHRERVILILRSSRVSVETLVKTDVARDTLQQQHKGHKGHYDIFRQGHITYRQRKKTAQASTGYHRSFDKGVYDAD